MLSTDASASLVPHYLVFLELEGSDSDVRAARQQFDQVSKACTQPYTSM